LIRYIKMDIKTAITIVFISIPFFLASVWAIVDVGQKDFGSTGKKALWGLTASIPFIGFLIYLIFGFRKGKNSLECRFPARK
jgi:uncharacterized membrane protein YhaH (DUF805 family)